MNKLSSLFSYVSKYRKQVYATIIAHILSALFTVISLPLIIPFFNILFQSDVETAVKPDSFWQIDQFLKYQFASLIENSTKQKALLYVCIAILFTFFFKNLFRYLASYFITPVRNNIVADMRDNLFQKYLSLPMSFYSEERKGNLITRMSTDITEIEHSILNVLEGAFKAPFILVGCLLFMLYISVKLTLFVFVLLIVVIFIIGTISRSLRRESGQAQSSISNIISLLEESLGGIKIIKAFKAEEFQKSRFSAENRKYKTILTRIIRRRDLSSPLSEFLGVTIVAILLFYGSQLVFTGQLKPETFFAFIFAFYSIIEPAKLLSNAYYNVQKGLASVDRIEEMQLLQNEIHNNQGDALLDKINEGIHFKNIHFTYPNSDNPVLENLNLFFPANKITALVGLSGAGKTSVVDLIPRFYDPTEGEIFFDKIHIQSLNLDSIRENIGLVSQDAVLFNDTIKNNLTFGTKDLTDEKIMEAVKLANAWEFIQNTELGFETLIGDRGVKLSGGQRQRLTLARAILKNAPILILDEATSALDAESETKVQSALDGFMANRTTIVIAHRLSTVKQADNIYVLRDGKLVEQGTHEQLIENKNEYFRFVSLQELSNS
jgi:subfamily B ATP-binding cassette protein MsbA